MNANYHTHTYRCKHAIGDIQDYIKEAEIGKLEVLGFSDHCPFPGDTERTWFDVRMSEKEAPEYIDLINKEQANTKIKLLKGFECEYSPEFDSWYKDFLLGELNADYLVLGQHWYSLYGDYLFCPEIKDTATLLKYFDELIKAMQTKYFAFLAHPDIIFLKGNEWNDTYKSAYSDIIDLAIELDMPLEINGYGTYKKPLPNGKNNTRQKTQTRFQYPYDKFWELVKEKGAKVICNSDAHDPKLVAKNRDRALDYAKLFDFSPVTEIKLYKD